MKIAICSDLHLEFGPIDLNNTDGADVLILSGDICVAKGLLPDQTSSGVAVGTRSQRYHDFFQHVTGQFKNVIYVLGNHEHYHGDFAKTLTIVKENLAYLKNLHILEKETVTIDDVTFVGGTLWTDMNNEDPLTLFHMKGMMNDFIEIKNSNHETSYIDEDGNFQHRTPRFLPEDAVEEHKKTLEYIRTVIEGKENGTFVVVGHHSPSRTSTHPRYAHDTVMNGGYSSHLDFFIEDHPQIKLWTHGHTHEPFDYNIGVTRIVCNPRGYINYEPGAAKFKLKYVSVK